MLRAFENFGKERLADWKNFVVRRWQLLIHNCQLKNKEALGNFKCLSQDEGQADFAKHISVSSFNEVLSVRSISMNSTFK